MDIRQTLFLLVATLRLGARFRNLETAFEYDHASAHRGRRQTLPEIIIGMQSALRRESCLVPRRCEAAPEFGYWHHARVTK
jgi:hypothetical protein